MLASIDGNLEEVARGAAQAVATAEQGVPERLAEAHLLLGTPWPTGPTKSHPKKPRSPGTMPRPILTRPRSWA